MGVVRVADRGWEHLGLIELASVEQLNREKARLEDALRDALQAVEFHGQRAAVSERAHQGLIQVLLFHSHVYPNYYRQKLSMSVDPIR